MCLVVFLAGGIDDEGEPWTWAGTYWLTEDPDDAHKQATPPTPGYAATPDPD
jgi:hypothetical protein